ncbi:MAG: release factor glutamine methyltransferase [Solirubrobacteraceae bacterium]|nr:release factor glutamine methyltransferase [Solirubrobacteraceae bacterium]
MLELDVIVRQPIRAGLGDEAARATAALARAGCDTPRLDAELLLAEALGVDRTALLTRAGGALEPKVAERFEALVARRAAREPIAYILGRRAFRHIELQVDARVLIPRPETEHLVEAALELPHGTRVIDVGTGSGAVALALKHERPDLRVTATEASAGALEVAAANARRLGIDVRLRRSDLFADAGGPFDALVANLPYVVDSELDRLEPEISRYEPRVALAGGADGLAVLRRLIDQAQAIPFVALEVGAGQARAVADMLQDAGAGRVEARRDLAGIERVVVGRR